MNCLVLHIDRVVLNGYPAKDGAAIVDGLRDELARHYAAPEAVRALQARPNVDSTPSANVSVARSAKPRAIGRQAARGIVKGLSR